MTTISARPILSSRHAVTGDTLHTLLLRYPRFIHAEFMTHRLFSRNASSSRAIPVEKLIEDVEADPVVPLFWGKNQKGMQAGEEMSERERRDAKLIWEQAMNAAIIHAKRLAGVEAHKQIVNRLLEPFSHITVVCSSTNWSNFLYLRDHPDAEPHIRMLAKSIRSCIEGAPVQELRPGDWHLPFTTPGQDTYLLDELIKISVARCASTSYKTVDGFDMTFERAAALHDKLVGADPLHASPCEHVAQADERIIDDIGCEVWLHGDQHGNFTGFRQYRKMLPGECR